MTKILAVLLCVGSVAVAEPDKQEPAAGPKKITSTPAKVLIRGLKLAGATSSTAKTTTTWTAKLLDCTTTKPQDVYALEETTCQADAKKLTGAAALVLDTAMRAAEIPEPYYMGKTEIKAAALTCVMDTHPSGNDGPFVCTYTPVGR